MSLKKAVKMGVKVRNYQHCGVEDFKKGCLEKEHEPVVFALGLRGRVLAYCRKCDVVWILASFQAKWYVSFVEGKDWATELPGRSKKVGV